MGWRSGTQIGNTPGSESELGMCRTFPLLLNRKFPAEGPGEEKDKTSACSHAKDTAAVWAPESLTAAPLKDKKHGLLWGHVPRATVLQVHPGRPVLLPLSVRLEPGFLALTRMLFKHHGSTQVFLTTRSFLESGCRKVPKGSPNHRVALLRGDDILKGGA